MSQIILNPKYQYVADHLFSSHRTGIRDKDTTTKAYAQLIAEGLQLAEEYDNKNNNKEDL